MLAGAMVLAGVTHLTVARKEFQAQVPPWAAELSPLDEDAIERADRRAPHAQRRAVHAARDGGKGEQ